MAPRSTTDDLHWWNEILALAYVFFIMPWCLYGNVRVVDSSKDISRKCKLCFNVGLIDWIDLVGTWLIPNTQLPWLDWESTGTKWFLPSAASCQQPCSTVPRIRVLKESPFRTWRASGRLCPIKLCQRTPLFTSSSMVSPSCRFVVGQSLFHSIVVAQHKSEGVASGSTSVEM